MVVYKNSCTRGLSVRFRGRRFFFTFPFYKAFWRSVKLLSIFTFLYGLLLSFERGVAIASRQAQAIFAIATATFHFFIQCLQFVKAHQLW
ncbi:MAG TPA: hypothetical protein V6C85_34365 [Allocoleopsis sp.]